MQHTQSFSVVFSGNLLVDAKRIIEQAKVSAYRSVDYILVYRNWLLGKRIAEEDLKGERAMYGAQTIKMLSQELTNEYGRGFTKTNLYQFVLFYNSFPDIFHTLSGKSSIMLSWSHYRTLLQENNEEARNWYARESVSETWSVRTLQRNISSQYYYRMLSSQDKDGVRQEMQLKTEALQDKLELIKNPIVAEFLGLSPNGSLYESNLETAIITHLQQFLMELGKGYAFVARQQHIHTEKEDYYIDLVFYNVILKCYVLIDLKTSKVSHQDVGQMDMYVRMYDEIKRTEGDNPTIGILLCADTDDDIARFSVLKGNEQLFASKYLTYLPTKEELKREIEQQTLFYNLQK